MEVLRDIQTLFVKQKKEWGEILSGFETKNKYAITDLSGNHLLFAAEESSFLARMFFKAARPFTMHIMDSQGNSCLVLRRPFRFFLHEISISDDEGKFLGSIKLKFSLFTRNLLVFNSQGEQIFKIFGPFFHPWTFQILNCGLEVGKISKKWSGLGKEMFTDADNFNITFPSEITLESKAVLLGALFLIDIVYFERTK